jgi:hypothetical protein
MKRAWTVLDLLKGAMEKLSPQTGERQNVLAFIQSCYGGRVLSFNLERALESLAKLTAEEEHCLITWNLLDSRGRTPLARRPLSRRPLARRASEGRCASKGRCASEGSHRSLARAAG